MAPASGAQFAGGMVIARRPEEAGILAGQRRCLDGAVLGAGLAIEAVDEPHADEATASAHPEVADSRVAPYILLVRARKPGDQRIG